MSPTSETPGSVSVSFVVINKDDPAVEATLAALTTVEAPSVSATELVVVDASEGRLDHVRDAFPAARWIAFAPRPGKKTIPEQRNVGIGAATGDVVVFIDASCTPDPGWLELLVAPIASDGESVVAGATRSSGSSRLRDQNAHFLGSATYIHEAPTINLAVTREVFDRAGTFDETFHYGSDVDFTWRVVDAGFRIRYVPEAIVAHDWGDARAEMRRSYLYGQARYRLYAKHASRRRQILQRDPIAVVYPPLLLALPLLLLRPKLLSVLLVPIVKNRRHSPLLSLADHLVFAAGILSALRAHATGRLSG